MFDHFNFGTLNTIFWKLKESSANSWNFLQLLDKSCIFPVASSDVESRKAHLSNDRLLASVAASLLGGLYSLAWHVCSEGSEHMFQTSLTRGLRARVAAVVFLPRALLANHVGAAFCSCNLETKCSMLKKTCEKLMRRNANGKFTKNIKSRRPNCL